jgi:hypothetical protein
VACPIKTAFRLPIKEMWGFLLIYETALDIIYSKVEIGRER